MLDQITLITRSAAKAGGYAAMLGIESSRPRPS